jgi:hypothetical protein
MDMPKVFQSSQALANLARAYFESGKDYLAQVKNIRLRIAGYAYISRFEVVLDAIEGSDYRLALEYQPSRSLGAELKMRGSVLSLAFFAPMRK